MGTEEGPQGSGRNCYSEPLRPTRRRCVGFFCAVGPLILKPSSDFASIARRGLGAVNVSRNDLFKAWFTKNYVRHAVVPLQDHEAWLANILTDWQFTA